MKTVFISVLMLACSGLALANESAEAEAIREECTAIGKDEGLTGADLDDYVKACIEERKASKD